MERDRCHDSIDSLRYPDFYTSRSILIVQLDKKAPSIIRSTNLLVGTHIHINKDTLALSVLPVREKGGMSRNDNVFFKRNDVSGPKS